MTAFWPAGAVVKASHDAKALKDDCRAFIRVVRSVEGILEGAAVSDQLGPAAEAPSRLIEEALREGLAHTNTLRTQSAAVAVRAVARRRGAFWMLPRARNLGETLARSRFRRRSRCS